MNFAKLAWIRSESTTLQPLLSFFSIAIRSDIPAALLNRTQSIVSHFSCRCKNVMLSLHRLAVHNAAH